MFRVCVLAVCAALVACPRGAEDTRETVHVGVDSAFVDTGLADYLRAAYEGHSKKRLELRVGTADEVRRIASSGEVDLLLLGSDPAFRQAEDAGVVERATIFAHEEFIFIGPHKDVFGSHGSPKPVDLVRNILRANHKFVKAKKGSGEDLQLRHYLSQTSDRGDIGSMFDTSLEGTPLAKEVIKRKAIGLVRRSAVLLAAIEGTRPERTYMESHPEQVLRLRAIAIRTSLTKRPDHSDFLDFLESEDGKKIVAAFGQNRFGKPLYGQGDVAEGIGARAPGALEKDATKIRIDTPPGPASGPASAPAH